MLRPSWPLLTEHQIDNESPSRKDGWTLKKEKAARKKAVACIMEAGQELELPSPCVTHAVAMWQRYFTVRSLQNTDSFILACACLLTASKAEDFPKSLGDVAYVAYKTMWKNKPSVKAKLQDQAFFSHLKEAIIVAERALLYMLGFEFTMVNPQRVAIIMIQRYMPDLSTETCQLVINVLNDQLKTTLMLQYPAKILAVAALKWILSFVKHKPGEYVDAEPPSTPSNQPPAPSGKVLWWQHALADNPHANMLEACERSVRGLYEMTTFGDSAEANIADAGSGVSGHTHTVPAVDSPNQTVQAASPAAVPTPSPSDTGPSPQLHPQEQPSSAAAGFAGDANKAGPSNAPEHASAAAVAAQHDAPAGQPGALSAEGNELQLGQNAEAAGVRIPGTAPAQEHKPASLPSHVKAEPGIGVKSEGSAAIQQALPTTQGHQLAADTSLLHQDGSQAAQAIKQEPGLAGIPVVSGHSPSAQPVTGQHSQQQQQQVSADSSKALPTAHPGSAALVPNPGTLQQQSPLSIAAASRWREAKAAALGQPGGGVVPVPGTQGRGSQGVNAQHAWPARLSPPAAAANARVKAEQHLPSHPPQTHAAAARVKTEPQLPSHLAQTHVAAARVKAEQYPSSRPPQTQAEAAAEAVAPAAVAAAAPDGWPVDLQATGRAAPRISMADPAGGAAQSAATPAISQIQTDGVAPAEASSASDLQPPATAAAPAADPLSQASSASPSKKRPAEASPASTAPENVASKKKARLERLSKWKDAQAAKGVLSKPQGPSAPATAGPSPADSQIPASSVEPPWFQGSEPAARLPSTGQQHAGHVDPSAEASEPSAGQRDLDEQGGSLPPSEQDALHAPERASSNPDDPIAPTEGAAGSSAPKAAGHEPLAPVLIPTNAPAVPDHLPLDQHKPAGVPQQPQQQPDMETHSAPSQLHGAKQLASDHASVSEHASGATVLPGPPKANGNAVLMQEQPPQDVSARSDGQQGAENIRHTSDGGQHRAAGLAAGSQAQPPETEPATQRSPVSVDNASQMPESVAPDASGEQAQAGVKREPLPEPAHASASSIEPGQPSAAAAGREEAPAAHLTGSEAAALLPSVQSTVARPAVAGSDAKPAVLDASGSRPSASASMPAAEPASSSQPPLVAPAAAAGPAPSAAASMPAAEPITTSQPPSAAPAEGAGPSAKPAAAVPTTSIKVADNDTLKLTGTFKPGKLPHGNPAAEAAAAADRGDTDRQHSHQARPQLESTFSDDAAKPREGHGKGRDSHSTPNGKSRTARDIVREAELLPGPPPLGPLISPEARRDSRDARPSKQGRPDHDQSSKHSQRHARDDRSREHGSSEHHRAPPGSTRHGHANVGDWRRSHSLGSEREPAPKQGKRHHRDDWLGSPSDNGHSSHFTNEPPSAKRPHLTPFSDPPHLSGSGSIHSKGQDTPHDRHRRCSADLKSHGSGSQRSRKHDRSAVHGNDYYDDPEPGMGDDLYRDSARAQPGQGPGLRHGRQVLSQQPLGDDRWGLEDGLPPHIELEKPSASSARQLPPVSVSVQPVADAKLKKPARELSPGELSGTPSAGEGSPDAAGKRSVFTRISR